MFAIFGQHQVAFSPFPFVYPASEKALHVACVIYELKPAIIWQFLILNFAGIIWQRRQQVSAYFPSFPALVFSLLVFPTVQQGTQLMGGEGMVSVIAGAALCFY